VHAVVVELQQEMNAAGNEENSSDPSLAGMPALAAHRADTLPRELTRRTAGKAPGVRS